MGREGDGSVLALVTHESAGTEHFSLASGDAFLSPETAEQTLQAGSTACSACRWLVPRISSHQLLPALFLPRSQLTQGAPVEATRRKKEDAGFQDLQGKNDGCKKGRTRPVDSGGGKRVRA